MTAPVNHQQQRKQEPAQGASSKACLFKLGPVSVSTGADKVLSKAGVSFVDLVSRHVRGFWGDVSEFEAERNARAVADGERILSVYEIDGTAIFVTTAHDRSVTNVLLPTDF